MRPAHTIRRKLAAAIMTGGGVLAAPAYAEAAFVTTTMDLTTAGSSGTSQGAYFFQADPHPTGTGYIDPFVRIQMRGTERGYNTDARPVEFDTKDENQWTHSLQLSNLAPVTIDSTQYYKFSLDINEQGNTTGSKLSMNDFRVYLGDSGSLTGWNDGFGTHSVKVYDIDAEKTAKGNKTIDTTVELNYRLGHGSGSGDLNVYIPVSYFQGFGSQFQYVYLYSSFGNPNASDAGFEEWWAETRTSVSPPPPPPPPPPGAVPAPPAVLLALAGVGTCLLGRGFRRRAATPPTA